MMHDLFSRIITISDTEKAVMRMALSEEISEEEVPDLVVKIKSLISQPLVNDWFQEGNIVMNEATILMPDSGTRRPDRVIVRDGKTYLVDFKFGEENSSHSGQVRNYSRLLSEMGYDVAGAYIWYVDVNRIITA